MARYLGIEVTETQLKLVVLFTAYRKLHVEQVLRVGMTPGPELEGLTSALHSVAPQLGSLDGVYAALGGQDVSQRAIELPRAVARRGTKVISGELEGALPFELDQATVDAQLVQDGDPTKLLAVAVRTEKVRLLVQALKAAGLDPREVGVGPLALGELTQAIPQLATPGPVMLVHAYELRTDVTILRGGVVELGRTLGNQQSVQHRLRSLRQTLLAYLAQGGEAPQAVYVTGEQGPTLTGVLADALEVPHEVVAMGLPQGTLTVSPALDPSELQLAPLALALALRGAGRSSRVDLRKGNLAVTSNVAVLRERWMLLASCAAALVLSWGAATWARYRAAVSDQAQLARTLAQVTQDAFGEAVRDPRRALALARGQGTETVQDPLPLTDAYDVLGVLSARIPEAVRHDVTSLDVQDERFQLQGLVASLQDRDRIVEGLQQWECFETVTAGRAQRNPSDERQQYSVEAVVRCPERRAPAQGARGGAGNNRSGSAGGGSGSAAGAGAGEGASRGN